VNYTAGRSKILDRVGVWLDSWNLFRCL